MNKLLWRLALVVASLLWVVIHSRPSLAIDDQVGYPHQSIHIIVPFVPAGAADFVARSVQNSFSGFLGQSVIIDNRPGASGTIGTAEAARAPSDGYTLFLGNVGTLSVNPSLFPHLQLRPHESFSPISLIADMPDVLIANNSFPPNSVKELVDYVKSKRGVINFASPGSGSLNRLEMEVFRKDAELEMQHVPYKGGAASAVMDVLAGHVDLMFTTIASAIEQIKNHNVKVLAVTSKERIPALPDVPTMLELGYRNSVSSSWQGLLVPKDTSRAIIDLLYQTTVHVVSDSEVQRRLIEGGVLPVISKSPEEFASFIGSEAARWGKVVKETGATAD